MGKEVLTFDSEKDEGQWLKQRFDALSDELWRPSTSETLAEILSEEIERLEARLEELGYERPVDPDLEQ